MNDVRKQLALNANNIELTDDEAGAVAASLFRERANWTEEEFTAAFDTVATWVQQTKLDAHAISLIMQGLINVAVDEDGEIRFRISLDGLQACRPN